MEMATRDDLGMIWMGDMLLSHEPTEMMLDPQSGSPFFNDSPHSLEDMRGRMPLEMEGFSMLDEYESLCEEAPRYLTSASTQTSGPLPTRKIKPIKHPALKLKTPIAYQKDTDLSVIPIQRDGMAVCEKCGAIGVKHAFYTKERRFCSLACAREYSVVERTSHTISNPLLDYPPMEISFKEEVKEPDVQELPPISLPLDDPPSPVMVKRNRSELANTYEWKSQLSETGFIAAPVSCFSHNITVGMKVEVENTDCDDFTESFPDSFWVATVLRIAGYKALLRYEGFGQNSSKDFWINLCSNSVHPVAIADRYKDWKDFLVKRLTGARTLPSNFYSKVAESLSSRFRCGLNLEVVDKNRISQVKVATIEKIVGKRLHVRYYNADPDDNGFWCHEDSPLIHPEGMKLEAIDPLNLSAICVATVMKVLRDDYIMIRIDSYDEDASGADWFCYHASSPCIFPAGFCDVNSITLTPPKGYEQSEFDWAQYLSDSNLTTAPLEVPAHGFIVGMRLEAADLMDPRLVCVGTISRVVGRLLKVHFDGWEEEYDQWLDCESPDMYPVGWCHLVGHKLEGPRAPSTKASAAAGKTPKGVKKKPRRRHKRAIAATAGTSAGSKSNGSPSERILREPAQATKLAASDNGTEGLPKEGSNGLPGPGREPEMGQEPAGPDQSLPVSSEPGSGQQPPLPRERTATSYINSTGASGKLIPRLVDATGSIGEPGELVPAEWNVFDVAQFLRVNDCAAYCDSFSRRVGPSLKIYDLIQQLKIKINPAQERMKASLKKLL
ncbi:hypothetical protein C0J52_16697 [Blattella germanica]|nr:hypothetical protein C0J52_16697 [Blattella germanica]